MCVRARVGGVAGTVSLANLSKASHRLLKSHVIEEIKSRRSRPKGNEDTEYENGVPKYDTALQASRLNNL